MNESFLTDNAKNDINKLLGRDGSDAGKFSSQIETTEGLTLAKGTENEASITGAEIKSLINNKVDSFIYGESETYNVDAGETISIDFDTSYLINYYDFSTSKYIIMTLPFTTEIAENFTINYSDVELGNPDGDEVSAVNSTSFINDADSMTITVNLTNHTNKSVSFSSYYFCFILIKLTGVNGNPVRISEED